MLDVLLMEWLGGCDKLILGCNFTQQLNASLLQDALVIGELMTS